VDQEDQSTQHVFIPYFLFHIGIKADDYISPEESAAESYKCDEVTPRWLSKDHSKALVICKQRSENV
jgi:hypothetical protein